MTMLRRLIPAPWLSIGLFVLWLALARSAAPAQIVPGVALALVIPVLTARLRLEHARLRRPGQAVRFLARVAFDVIASNLIVARDVLRFRTRSEEHTSELQSLMRTSYAVFCLKKKNTTNATLTPHTINVTYQSITLCLQRYNQNPI